MRLQILAVLALAALTVAGCGDSTGPGSSFGVNLSVTGQPTPSVSEVDGGLRMRCDVQLIASPRGTGSAAWRGGVMRFYYGSIRKVAVDSQLLSVAEVESAWGARITTDAERSDWYFTAALPFDVEIEFRLANDDGGKEFAAKTRFTCGPPPPATDVAPTISSIIVAPATGEVQAGDTLLVTYTANSPNALWSSYLSVDGPFGFRHEFAENGATTATRTVKVPVPPASFFERPILVSVTATDAGGLHSSKGLQTSLTVVDRTPPVLEGAWVQGQGNHFVLAGAVLALDTLRLSIDAHDNNSVAWLVWELSGAANSRDSVHAPTGLTSGITDLKIPVRPEWIGNSTLSVYVRDGTGAASAVLTGPANGVTVYPFVVHPVAVATAPASISQVYFGDVAWDVKRHVFYVTLGQTNEIQVLDETTMSFGAPIVLDSPGEGMDLMPSGDSLIVVQPASKSLLVVDLTQPTAVPVKIPLSVLDTAGALYVQTPPLPVAVRVAANGMALVELSTHTRSDDGLISVDLRGGAQAVRSDGRGRTLAAVLNLGATPDRSRVVIYEPACPRLYVAQSDSFTACTTGVYPQNTVHLLSFDAAGTRFSVGNSVYDMSFTPLSGTREDAGMSVLSPDGGMLYLNAGGKTGVTKVQISDGTPLEGFELPIAPQRMFMARDGQWMMVFRKETSVVKAARVDLR